MRKKLLLLCCVIIGIVFLALEANACSVVPSKIDSFSPTEIVPNETEVTINGSNFNDDMQDSKVNFGPYMPGTIISWSDTKIVARVPYNVYKELSVDICCGWQCQSSNRLAFSIKPRITNLSPNVVMSGQALTISGDNFGSVQGSVYIGGQQAEITQWYNTSATVIVPNITNGNTNVEVRTSSGSISKQNSIEIISSCTSDNWSCTDWGPCSVYGKQTKTCSKISNCEGGVQSPTITQSCTYIPVCSQDTWQCGNWGTCSPQGTQSRSCDRTYDCPSAETAAPATSQYCEAPNQPKLQSPTEDLGIVNQDSIIKSTVKLICPVSRTMASQGSGTVIDSKGTILTNKHVIDGTPGCLVGFIDNYDDEPYFGDRQIADIYKVSSDADVAVLKLRNPNNKTLVSVNISQGNSSSIKLGEILTTYGYPAKFGTKITYTSGDFSGVDGNYLKTTAVIEHGNSGGGAYLKNGTFIGIPTAVIKGSLNSMGYLLSVNKVNSWLNNSVAYNNNSNNNNYSRVSAILDDMDLNALGSLGLFVAGDEKNVKTGAESQIDKNLSNRLKGKILLQVENHGEAWYVNPKNSQKYYMANGNEAYRIMRYLGVGITNKDLNKVKTDKSFAKKQSGKIFLQTESHGEAYYIDSNGVAHYLEDGSAAYTIMRELGLGIKNNDLSKISEGSL